MTSPPGPVAGLGVRVSSSRKTKGTLALSSAAFVSDASVSLAKVWWTPWSPSSWTPVHDSVRHAAGQGLGPYSEEVFASD